MTELPDGLDDLTMTVEVVEPKTEPRKKGELPEPKLWHGRRVSSWEEALEVGPRLLLAADRKAVRVTDLLTQQSEIFRSADDFGRFAQR